MNGRIHQVRGVILALIGLLMSACGINAPRVTTQVVTVPPPPTNTLAPVFTFTPRYTATPIPTSTLIPTNTLPATATPPVPTATPVTPTIAAVSQRGSVSFGSTTVRLREGPSTEARTLSNVAAGTPLNVLGASEDRLWYFVVLDDGREGWMSAEFITVGNPTAVAIIPPAQLTQRAQQPTPPVNVRSGTVVPTLRARATGPNDVLAYCDLPDFRARESGKRFSTSTQVTLYWSWFAATPEQIQDHLDYGKYEVSMDLKVDEAWQKIREFTDWQNYQTGVVREGRQYKVYWFIPLGTLLPGEYRINYRLTWSQRVEDGEKTFGPGGEEEVNTGTCLFTVT